MLCRNKYAKSIKTVLKNLRKFYFHNITPGAGCILLRLVLQNRSQIFFFLQLHEYIEGSNRNRESKTY